MLHCLVRARCRSTGAAARGAFVQTSPAGRTGTPRARSLSIMPSSAPPPPAAAGRIHDRRRTTPPAPPTLPAPPTPDGLWCLELPRHHHCTHLASTARRSKQRHLWCEPQMTAEKYTSENNNENTNASEQWRDGDLKNINIAAASFIAATHQCEHKPHAE